MKKADRDRETLIRYLETSGTRSERVWLPLIRLVHRLATRDNKMNENGHLDSEDKMISVMERIARDLDRAVGWLIVVAALLALIAFLILLRTMIGR